MARKPETNFRLKIERRLPRALHREKMNNPFRGGTADSWYSGKGGDLWVEYKFLPRVPQRGIITPERLDLSHLQCQWLRGRHEEGRNVAVIVGTPAGGVIMRDLEWEEEVAVDLFVSRTVTVPDIALWIAQQTEIG